jgi:glycine cleavage system H protein
MSDERYPGGLLYHPDHDWVRIDGELATFGITWYAQDSLGEIVFWDAPKVGAMIRRGAPYAELESVKAVTDVVAPMSGEILVVNERISDELRLLNEDPYQEGWLVGVRLTDLSEVDLLLDADAYRSLL